MNVERNPRVLVIDDNASVQADYAKILSASSADDAGLTDMRSALFDDAPPERAAAPKFEVAFATQGLEGVELARGACESEAPFSLAFVDMRMPPGIDGLETIERLWKIDPGLEIVVCTAFSDHSFEDIADRLGSSSRLLVLKKPFDGVEILQIAATLGEKWRLARASEARIEELDAAVRARTSELAAANARLAEQVDELERANERLTAAIEAAGAASRAKTEFLTNMSHEIRTPITAILGFAELALDASANIDETREHLATIRRGGEHLLKLVQDVLDLAAIDAGPSIARKADCDARAIARECAETARAAAVAKGLAFESEIDESVPPLVHCEGEMIRRALAKLLDNAVKFTERGSVRFEMRSVSGAGSPRISFRVADTGPGIPVSIRSTVFQPFTTGDVSMRRKHGGSGVGLALAKHFVERLGGSLEFDSSVDAGTTFTFAIPAEAPTAVIDARIAGPAGQFVSASLAARRVLLAEDGLDNQRLIGTILRKAGSLVEFASDGARALELVEAARIAEEPHDLILLDMQMPGMDGYEAARKLRERGIGIPIVALTAHAMPGDRERCLFAGCDDYLTKPVDRARLIATCAALLARADGVNAVS